MIEIIESATYRQWIEGLRDRRAVARITTRLRHLSLGNFGDARSVGNGISELRIHYGPGYRIYFLLEGRTVVVLLCGGDKDSQQRDIRRAGRLAIEWKESNA